MMGERKELRIERGAATQQARMLTCTPINRQEKDFQRRRFYKLKKLKRGLVVTTHAHLHVWHP